MSGAPKVIAGPEPDTPPGWPARKARVASLCAAGRVVFGVSLVALGALGLVLPVIPGIPLLIAGVALLGPKHPLVRPVAERVARWRGRRK